MYVASHTHTIAIDAVTGRQKWKAAIELPNDIAGYLCCGIHTRGMAALDGVLYRTTIDAHVLAISMADGKLLWKQKAADYKEGYSHDARAADRRRRADHRHLRRRVRHARLPRRLGPENRREEVAPLDHRRARRARRRHLEGRRPQDRWRTDLADRQLRPRARPRLLGHRQRRPVERGHARRRFALHRLGAGAQAVHRRDRLALPVLARRPVRLRRHERAGAGRPADRRQDHQGADAGQPQRLLLRDRPHQRQADLGARSSRARSTGPAASTRPPGGRSTRR